MMHGQADIR